MGASLGGAKGKKNKPAMNVTPLVDVVLVLLIIFMVILPNQERGATIEVPTIQTGEDDPEDGPEPFTVSIDEGGALFVDDLRVGTDDEFVTVLDRAHEVFPDRKVLLRVDRDVPYLRVRTLFKLAQDVGFPGVMLRVNSDQSAAPASEG